MVKIPRLICRPSLDTQKKDRRNWRSKERIKKATKKKESLPAKSRDPLLTWARVHWNNSPPTQHLAYSHTVLSVYGVNKPHLVLTAWTWTSQYVELHNTWLGNICSRSFLKFLTGSKHVHSSGL